jgi:hypothetical protein
MAINTTTLSAAITASQTQFAVASTTNITAPVLTTGSGYTWLLVEAELMWVTAVPASGVVQVTRGMLGTQAVAHSTTATVTIGLPTDFPVFVPKIQAFRSLEPDRFQGVYAPVASAASITATGPIFHVTGGTAINIINPPANFVEGTITILFDSACTWTSSAVTYGIAASGTCTTAKSAVSFTYDTVTALWYPSRLA